MKQSERTRLMLARIQRALDLRNEGMTYKEVGARMDPPVSKERARQMIVKGERMNRSGNSVVERLLATSLPPTFSALPRQLKNALRNEFGPPSLVDDAEMAALIISKGVTFEKAIAMVGGVRIRGVGKVGAQSLIDALGITRPDPGAGKLPPSDKAIAAALRTLDRAGYNTSQFLTDRENREKSGESA